MLIHVASPEILSVMLESRSSLSSSLDILPSAKRNSHMYTWNKMYLISLEPSLPSSPPSLPLSFPLFLPPSLAPPLPTCLGCQLGLGPSHTFHLLKCVQTMWEGGGARRCVAWKCGKLFVEKADRQTRNSNSHAAVEY